MLTNLKTRLRAWIWMQADGRPFRLVMGVYLAGLLSAGLVLLLLAVLVWTF